MKRGVTEAAGMMADTSGGGESVVIVCCGTGCTRLL